MFKICDLILDNNSIVLPVINLETENYDIYGTFTAKITVILEQPYDAYKLYGQKCSIGKILTGFISKVSNASIDSSILSLSITSSLSFLYSNKLKEQKIFSESSLQDIIFYLSKDYFSVSSLFHDKKSVLISPGSLKVIIQKLLESYNCHYIFLGPQNKLMLFKDFRKYKREQLSQAINLKYKFEYGISSCDNYYFSYQNLYDHYLIETNNLNITPGQFITLDDKGDVFFIKSALLHK